MKKETRNEIKYQINLRPASPGAFKINGYGYHPTPEGDWRGESDEDLREAVNEGIDFANRSYKGTDSGPSIVNIRRFKDGGLTIVAA